MSNFDYKKLEYEEDLIMLTKNKYYVSANFNGSNCLLVFTKVVDKYLSFLIDRKTLKFNKSKLSINDVKIIKVVVRLDESIYNDTIFDGTLISSDDKKKFMISDCYYFRGKNMMTTKIQHKIQEMREYLKYTNIRNRTNSIELQLNVIYPIEKTKEFTTTNIPSTKDYIIRGLVFYPEISGTKLLFMFNSNKKDLGGVTKPKKKQEMKFVITEPLYATFDMKRTEFPDVFKLYLSEFVKENQKNLLKSKKMGIAWIPTMECSQLCSKILENKTNALVKCKYIPSENKWQPIELDCKSKYPTNISTLQNKMENIE